MPSVKQTYKIQNVSIEDLYSECTIVLSSIGASDVSEIINDPKIKTIEAWIPSIWGWGGMRITVYLIEEENNFINLSLDGYISQAGVTPLTKKMDQFLQKLHESLKMKYDSNFEYEKLTRFIPKYKLKFTDRDKKVLISLTLMTLIFLIIDISGALGYGVEISLIAAVLWLGYKIVTKYLK